MARLGDLVTVSASSEQLTGDKFWLLNLDMIEQQTGRIVNYLFVDETKLDGSIIQFDTDTVLYSKLRPNLNKVVLPQMCGYATSELLPLKPDSKLYKHYLAIYLRSDAFVTWAVSKTAGAKMPRLGTKELLNKDIPLPSLDEQKRIAECFEKIDELIFLRKQQLSKLDELVKSRFIEMMGSSELSGDLTVEQITERVKVGFVGTCEKYYTDEIGIPMLRTGNITDHGIDMRDLKYVTTDFHEKNKKSQIRKGDLLIARHGSNGQANVYSGPEAQCLNAVVIVPNQSVARSVFLAGLINSPRVKEQINRTLVGSTQHVVNTKSIANLVVRIPCIEVQKRYEVFVEQTDKSKFEIQKSLEKLETLKKALMQKYFG